MPLTRWDLKEELVRVDHAIYRAINLCNILQEANTKAKLEVLRGRLDDALQDLMQTT